MCHTLGPKHSHLTILTVLLKEVGKELKQSQKQHSFFLSPALFTPCVFRHTTELTYLSNF